MTEKQLRELASRFVTEKNKRHLGSVESEGKIYAVTESSLTEFMAKAFVDLLAKMQTMTTHRKVYVVYSNGVPLRCFVDEGSAKDYVGDNDWNITGIDLVGQKSGAEKG